jgi:predicted ATP-binding protein involved in virulence
LQNLFPNAQFIVTTHSPHVVTSVKPNELFVINNFQIDNNIEQSFGINIQRALEDIMGVKNSRNEIVQHLITKLWDSVKMKNLMKIFTILKMKL